MGAEIALIQVVGSIPGDSGGTLPSSFSSSPSSFSSSPSSFSSSRPQRYASNSSNSSEQSGHLQPSISLGKHQSSLPQLQQWSYFRSQFSSASLIVSSNSSKTDSGCSRFHSISRVNAEKQTCSRR